MMEVERGTQQRELKVVPDICEVNPPPNVNPTKGIERVEMVVYYGLRIVSEPNKGN